MPYAPGITDISGQLYAQGIDQASKAYASKVGNIAQSLTGVLQQFQQNQMLSRQAAGKIASLSQVDPQFGQYLMSLTQENGPNVTPEIKKAVQNFQGNKADVYDMALLSSLADTYAQDKQKNQQQQYIAAQTAQATQQAALLQQQVAQQGLAQESYKQALARQAERDAAGQGANQPLPIQAPSPAPAPAPAMGGGIPAVALGRFAGSPQAAAAVPAGVGQFLNVSGLRERSGQSEAAPWSENNPIGQIDARQIEDQMIVANMGKPVAAEKIAAEIDRRTKMKQSALERSDVKPSTTEIPINQGRDLAVIDTRTSQVLGTRPNEKHPDVIAGNELNMTRIKNAGTQSKEDIDAGKQARRVAVATDRLNNLISSGQLQTGKGQEFVNAARGWANALGAKVDEGKLSASNEGIAYLAGLVLPIYAEQKGAISEREQKLYASMSASIEKDPAANLALLKVAGERAKTDQQLERNAQDFNSGKIDHKEYYQRRQSILDSFDAKVPDLAAFQQSQAQAAIPAQSSIPSSRMTVQNGKLVPVASPTSAAPRSAKLPSGWSIGN